MPRMGKNLFQGTDSIMVDIGFEDAKELSTKASLAVKLNKLIDKRGLSQTDVARVMGMTQLKVSWIRSYQLQNISIGKLIQTLVSRDQRGRSLCGLRVAHGGMG